jgi:predicted  nucleic acid-binding Zn-ribbon protein
MSENVKNDLVEQLGQISLAISAVDVFSKKVQELSQTLDGQRIFTQKQLNEMNVALNSVQKVLEAVKAVNPSLEGFQTETRAATSLLNDVGQKMLEIADNVKASTDENLDAYKRGVVGLQSEIEIAKIELLGHLASTPEAINEAIDPTVTRLVEAAGNLGAVSDLVRGRLENLSSEMNLQILNRIAPEIEKLNQALLTARDSVSVLPDLVKEKMDDVHARGMSDLSDVVTSHEMQLERVKVSSQRLEDLLNRSDEFAKMATALKENEELLKMMLDALEERRPPLAVRLDIALLSAAAGYVVGVLVLEAKPADVAVIVTTSALLTLPLEPFIRKMIKALLRK